MRRCGRRGGAAVVMAVGLLLAGCGGSSDAAGHGDLALADRIREPDRCRCSTLGKSERDAGRRSGPLPRRLRAGPSSSEVPAGWTSTHRYADAFDRGPGRSRPADAPLVVVAVTTAPEPDADAAADGGRRSPAGRGPHPRVGRPARLPRAHARGRRRRRAGVQQPGRVDRHSTRCPATGCELLATDVAGSGARGRSAGGRRRAHRRPAVAGRGLVGSLRATGS